jgi:hypothetical protein
MGKPHIASFKFSNNSIVYLLSSCEVDLHLPCPPFFDPPHLPFPSIVSPPPALFSTSPTSLLPPAPFSFFFAFRMNSSHHHVVGQLYLSSMHFFVFSAILYFLSLLPYLFMCVCSTTRFLLVLRISIFKTYLFAPIYTI